MHYTELKTYEVVRKNYFWDNYDLEEFVEQVDLEYDNLIKSEKSLKILFRDLDRLKSKVRYKSEQLFEEIVQDDFTYIQNFLNAIHRIYVKKLDSRLSRIYRNKDNKEYFMYNLYYKDIELKISILLE